MPTINLAYLEEHHACSEQQDLFFRLFGYADVEVTVEAALSAYENGMDVLWLYETLKSESIRKRYSMMCRPFADAFFAEAEAIRSAYRKGDIDYTEKVSKNLAAGERYDRGLISVLIPLWIKQNS